MSADNRHLAQFARGFAALPEHRPWPAYRLDLADWLALLAGLAEAPAWTLLGLWGEPEQIWLALRDEADGAVACFALPCPDRHYPTVGLLRPAAIRLERVAADLFGLVADGAGDERPWLDHGRWLLQHPLSGTAVPATGTRPADDYAFLPAEGEALHQIPVGPVHAGIIEPGHFRFHASGETVARLEERLGYVHKGSEGLMAGRSPAEAARIAARLSGDSTVAHSIAFARAVEAATGTTAPRRADWLRALMAELERLANHFGDIAAICNDATFPVLQQSLMVLRERVLRAAASCFGHRLMMDRAIPGGVAVDLDPDQGAALVALARKLRPEFAMLMRIYDGRPSLVDRMVGTGITRSALIHRFAAGGHVGRAAGRGFDARVNPGYPPYGQLRFVVPVLAEGDVNARVLIRAREVEASLDLIEQIVAGLPGGPIAIDLPAQAGSGLALVESFRGEIMTWVRLDAAGRVARCHPRDPSWFQWPLLEAAIEGNIVADFPLCNKSFNCTYSGVDL
jgi:Ni,Fe-hydrogenase III large subunit